VRYNVLTYLIGEGIKNVLKNKKSTFASLGIMICTMFMFGVFFAIGENINHLMSQIQNEQGIRAFAIQDATDEQIDEARRQISNIDGVDTATIITKQEALDEMKAKFEKHPELMETYEGDNNIFPVSILVRLSDLEKNAEVQEKILNIQVDGVKVIEEIRSSDQTINALIKIANGIRLATGVILVLLIAISIFIISNTIKLTVHSRRKEISIMKYVGATNSFIRWPFVVEGMIIGIISGLLTLLIVAGIYQAIAPNLNGMFKKVASGLNLSLLPFNDMVLMIFIVYMILGVGIGIIGSLISMKRYLEV